MGLAGVAGGGEALPWCGGGDAATTPNHKTRPNTHTLTLSHTHLWVTDTLTHTLHGSHTHCVLGYRGF